MEYVYHIVAIRVNETSCAHIWRLCFRYLRTGYDTQPAPKLNSTPLRLLPTHNQISLKIQCNIIKFHSKTIKKHLPTSEDDYRGWLAARGAWGTDFWHSSGPTIYLSVNRRMYWHLYSSILDIFLNFDTKEYHCNEEETLFFYSAL
jgi:hypothetical protein